MNSFTKYSKTLRFKTKEGETINIEVTATKEITVNKILECLSIIEKRPEIILTSTTTKIKQKLL